MKNNRRRKSRYITNDYTKMYRARKKMCPITEYLFWYVRNSMIIYRIIRHITWNPLFVSLSVFQGIRSIFHKRMYVFILFTLTMGLPLLFSFRADVSFNFTEGHTNIPDGRYSRRRCTNFLINNRIISITPTNLCIHWLLDSAEGILFQIIKFVNNRLHDSHIGTRNLDN